MSKYQLSAWWNEELALRGHENFSSLIQYLQSHLRGEKRLSPPWLRAYATVADCHVAGMGCRPRKHLI